MHSKAVKEVPTVTASSSARTGLWWESGCLDGVRLGEERKTVEDFEGEEESALGPVQLWG